MPGRRSESSSPGHLNWLLTDIWGMTTPSDLAALGYLGSADPFSLKTVHWTVFRALEPSLGEGGYNAGIYCHKAPSQRELAPKATEGVFLIPPENVKNH